MAIDSFSDGISRRHFLLSVGCGIVLGVIERNVSSALAQVPFVIKPIVPLGLPQVGAIKVADLKLSINGTSFAPSNHKRNFYPPLAVAVAPNNGACTLELAAGINLAAEVTLAAAANNPFLYFGKLGFVQFARYKHQRSPSGLISGNKNAACTTSGGRFELDGSDPYSAYVDCGIGHNKCASVLNAAKMADDPGVPTEDATAYESVEVFPWDAFHTWLVWQETDNNLPETPNNKAKRHVLARVDWAWHGEAHSLGATCPSQAGHKGYNWDGTNMAAGISGVYFGKLAGTPPKNYTRAHNTAWVAGPC